MKYFSLLAIAMMFFFFAACDEDVNEPDQNTGVIESKTVSELNVWDENEVDTIRYFSLRENKVIPSSEANTTNWDIAFYRTTIYANAGQYGPGSGGIQTLSNTDFTYVTEAPVDSYFDVISGSEMGWYSYDFTTHTITPKAGAVVVVRCADNKYAKMQVLSYYKGYPDNIPDTPEEREDKHYTFKYAIQMDGSKDLN